MVLLALWLGASSLWSQTHESFVRRWTAETWTVEPGHAPLAARLGYIFNAGNVVLSLGDDGEFRLESGGDSVTGQWRYVSPIRTLVFEAAGTDAVRATVECSGERLCLTMRDGGVALRIEWTAQ